MTSMGATKVKTNFAEIEQRINESAQQQLTKLNENTTECAESQQNTASDENLDMVTNIRLAYKELSIRKEREEAKMKNIDPSKAKQIERLGMGFNYKKLVKPIIMDLPCINISNELFNNFLASKCRIRY